MLSGLELSKKYILVAATAITLSVTEFVTYAVEKDAHVTIMCPNAALSKQVDLKKMVLQGSIGHLEDCEHLRRNLRTEDYHLVILEDQFDYQLFRQRCNYTRTWLSVLESNALSDMKWQRQNSSEEYDHDSTTTKYDRLQEFDQIQINNEISCCFQSNSASDFSESIEDWSQQILSMEPKKPKLFIVGAGLGSPELITVKAQRLLQTVPIIITDRLVSPALLKTIPATVRVLFSRKVCGKANEAQKEINQWILEHLDRGLDVLRLKGGDPFVFGRGGEEWNLVSGKYEIEWVPGISSSIAAAGAAGIPVTHRGVADSFVVCTGTLMNPTNWSRIPEYDSKRTLILLMATTNFSQVVEMLVSNNGYPLDTPVAIVYKATLPEQKVLYSTLNDSPRLLLDSTIRNHSTIIVGDVVNCLYKK